MIRNDDDRISPPTRERDGTTILDIRNYAPFLLNAVSNGWQRKTSPIYREEFDISILDWRVIAMLSIEPDISAQRVCEVVRLDKAAVSRSLKSMLEREFVSFATHPSDTRRRSWRLTDKGQAVHDRCLEIALENEAELINGVAPENFEVFLRVMRRLLSNLND